MHEPQVEVVGLQFPQRFGELRLDVVRVVRVVPELGGEEDVGAGDVAGFYGFADGFFGAVARRWEKRGGGV